METHPLPSGPPPAACRTQAAYYRQLAQTVPTEEVRSALLGLAVRYDELADKAELADEMERGRWE